MYNLRNTNKQSILLEQNKKIFSTSDLAILWNIENKNTLWTTINRYLKRNILYPIHKGLYSTIPLEKLDKYELGCAVSGSLSYISAETVLQNSGVIMQNINQITLFGKKRKQFEINGVSYLCKYLNIKYLLNRNGINDQEQFSIATQDRAIADLLHINPKYYFDNDIAINMEEIALLSTKIGYSIKELEETRYNKIMTKDSAVNYWLTSAKHNSKTAKDMFKTGHYDWTLFMWHLVIEKTLKGIITNQGKTPPTIHDLMRLAEKAKLSLSKDQILNLEEISTFNIEARYDDYKFAFYKKATRSFTATWVEKAEEIYLWLKKQT